MGRYVAKRILQIIPIILVVSVLIFAIMSLVPSDRSEEHTSELQSR